ncbi:MAG: hypothetical protein J4N98_08675 [Chloroflexi bacterium]|nr:hypothetical protein [Chloroflexota bacterium]
MAQSSAEVAYEVALRRLDSQLHRVDVVDSKIAVVVGLGGTAIGIFAGFAAVAVEPDERASVIFAAIAGIIVLAVYALAVINALRVYAIGKWDERPNWEDLLKKTNDDLSEVQRWVARACVASLQGKRERSGTEGQCRTLGHLAGPTRCYLCGNRSYRPIGA